MACLVAFTDGDYGSEAFPPGVVIVAKITHGLARTLYREITRRCDFYPDGRTRPNKVNIDIEDILP